MKTTFEIEDGLMYRIVSWSWCEPIRLWMSETDATSRLSHDALLKADERQQLAETIKHFNEIEAKKVA